MRREPDRRASLEQRAERRQRGADTRVVRHLVAVERHVEVDPHEHALAARIEVLDRALAERHAAFSGRR